MSLEQNTKEFMSRTLPLIQCEPPLWARGGHAQTILAELLPYPLLKIKGERVQMKLPDGDVLACRFIDNDSPTIVVLFHGLAGDIKSSYMQRMAREIQKDGHSVFLMNHRNCGEGKGLSKKVYHCGRSEDLGFVIHQLRQRYPGKRIVAMGFSMSANALLLLMSYVIPDFGIYDEVSYHARKKELQISLPDLAITVNPPVHLQRTALRFNQGWNRPFSIYFVSYLSHLIRHLDSEGIISSPKRMSWIMPINEFDDRFVAPNSGFANGQEYYRKCSSYFYLNQVNRPTIVLTSKDDPFIDYNDILETEKSKSLQLHIEDQGGHLGYVHREKTPLQSHRWMDYALMETLRLMS